MKRVLSFLLALSVLCSLSIGTGLSAYAANTEHGYCGDKATYWLNTETGVMTIRGSSKITAHFKDLDSCSAIRSVDIGGGVVGIGAWAFQDCTNITSISVSDSVESIGYGAFMNCISLTDINLPEVESIGNLVFSGCSSLTHVTVPNGVTWIGTSAFADCKSLTDINIPQSVTRIGDSAFAQCTGLTKVTVPSGVTGIGSSAFSGCKLQELKVLGKSCKIGDLGLDTASTVCGFKNSTAQQYAEKYGLSFTAIQSCADAGLEHNYEESAVIAPTCTTSGYSVYVCTVCGEEEHRDETLALGHQNKSQLTKATATKDGQTYKKCALCGAVTGKTVLPKASNIKLSKTAYTYNGKVQKPSVTVKDSKGKTLKNGTDYKISYPKGMKNVGKYTVKVTLKGNYSGSKSLTYNINPKGTSVSKVTAAKKGFKVTWKKQATQTTGYEVQYSTSSNFKKGNKTVNIAKNKATSKSVSKLSAKKKYYVRVRTYKTVKVNGKNIKLYSGWSKAKSVTTKK